MVVDHRGLVTTVDGVRLRARSQADLNAAPGREILARNNVEDELHVPVPMDALFLGARRLRHVKPKVHGRAIRASLAGKHPREFDMAPCTRRTVLGNRSE